MATQTTPALDELFEEQNQRCPDDHGNEHVARNGVAIIVVAESLLSRRWAAVIIALPFVRVFLYEIPLDVILPDLMKLLL